HSGTALDLPPIAFNYRGCNPPCSEMDGRFLAQPSMPDTLLGCAILRGGESGVGPDCALAAPLVWHYVWQTLPLARLRALHGRAPPAELGRRVPRSRRRLRGHPTRNLTHPAADPAPISLQMPVDRRPAPGATRGAQGKDSPRVGSTRGFIAGRPSRLPVTRFPNPAGGGC
ncbi:MAG: hypothetical protein ACI89E_000933, partial [Planctomycetota bacterium]